MASQSLDLDRLSSITDDFLTALLPQLPKPTPEEFVAMLCGLKPVPPRSDLPQALTNLRRLSIDNTHVTSDGVESFLEYASTRTQARTHVPFWCCLAWPSTALTCVCVCSGDVKISGD
jgi:hypothetical protein